MITVPMPYYKDKLDVKVPKENFKALIMPKSIGTRSDTIKRTQEDIVLEALRNPLGTPTLCALAKGKKRVTVVTSDHTRNMPSKITLPVLLQEIRKGNPAAEITILIGTGLHRMTTKEEQRAMFGDRIVNEEKIVVNDAFDEASFRDIELLPSGASCEVNRIALDTDLLVTEGFIEPHFFAGFSGGRKSILPGICSAKTINENHSYKAIAHPKAATGVLEENPIHEDMLAAAKAAKVAFILNVTLNQSKEISRAVAGDLEKAHAEGVKFLMQEAQCQKITADIVVTSNGGFPLDQNLYQTPKAIATAEKCAGEDGVIIMFASCSDGIGGEYFEEVMKWGSPWEIDERLSVIPAEQTIPEMWCAQIYARILKKHKVILVSDFLDQKTVEAVNLIYAKTGDEAMQEALKIKGNKAEVVVIPDGVSTLIV
ncbi:MAG: nickel-dependent lactate racemase [Clostridia bacterium]|nr:nickel-dependent lactate racemase [Clostridia bacterium]